MHRICSSSAERVSECDIEERRIWVSNKKAPSLLSSSPFTDPTEGMVDNSDHVTSINDCSGMSSPSPSECASNCNPKTDTAAGHSIELESTQSQASAKLDETHPDCLILSPISTALASVCPVPMLPDFEKILAFKPQIIKSAEAQTSPVYSSSSSSGSSPYSANSNDVQSSSSPSYPSTSSSSSSRERAQKLRSLRESLMFSLRKKLSSLRSSCNSRVNGSSKESPPDGLGVVDFQSLTPTNEIGPVRVTLLGACEGGSYRIQLRRDCNYQPFGVYFKNDSKGVYICRIAKRVEMRGAEDYLRVNVRVLELQGVPSEFLDSERIRELLKGCLILTLKIRAACFH